MSLCMVGKGVLVWVCVYVRVYLVGVMSRVCVCVCLFVSVCMVAVGFRGVYVSRMAVCRGGISVCVWGRTLTRGRCDPHWCAIP